MHNPFLHGEPGSGDDLHPHDSYTRPLGSRWRTVAPSSHQNEAFHDGLWLWATVLSLQKALVFSGAWIHDAYACR